MRYVLGFAFSTDGRVALIRKNRPEQQAGRLNGIGGKIEQEENGDDAMIREFREETGVTHTEWTYRGQIWGDWGDVFVYEDTFSDDDFFQIDTVTDEEIERHFWRDVLKRTDILSNIPFLLLMCRNEKVQNFFVKMI